MEKGDKVYQKNTSNNKKMTVMKITGEDIECFWLDDNGNKNEYIFSKELLETTEERGKREGAELLEAHKDI